MPSSSVRRHSDEDSLTSDRRRSRHYPQLVHQPPLQESQQRPAQVEHEGRAPPPLRRNSSRRVSFSDEHKHSVPSRRSSGTAVVEDRYSPPRRDSFSIEEGRVSTGRRPSQNGNSPSLDATSDRHSTGRSAAPSHGTRRPARLIQQPPNFSPTDYTPPSSYRSSIHDVFAGGRGREFEPPLGAPSSFAANTPTAPPASSFRDASQNRSGVGTSRYMAASLDDAAATASASRVRRDSGTSVPAREQQHQSPTQQRRTTLDYKELESRVREVYEDLQRLELRTHGTLDKPTRSLRRVGSLLEHISEVRREQGL